MWRVVGESTAGWGEGRGGGWWLCKGERKGGMGTVSKTNWNIIRPPQTLTILSRKLL